jgi:hypothetical protein
MGCGLLLLASFWFASRAMDKGLPLLSVALVGLNATVIRYGDTLRGNGLGTACILITLGLVWQYVEAPTLRRGCLAALAAVVSVQALYQNAAFVLAMCLGGAAVLIRRGQRREVPGILGIGLTAAVSLLPYAQPIHEAQGGWEVLRTGFDWSHCWDVINAKGGMLPFLCGILVLGAAVAGGVWSLRKAREGESRARQDLPLFASVAMIVGLAGFWCFFKLNGLPTKRWYYILPFGFAAACCDAILPRIHPAARTGVAIIAVVVALVQYPALNSALQWRQTDADLLAAQVSHNAAREDYVIVNPWFCGYSFARYYRGSAPWTTLPPMGDYRFHRYDLIRAKLQMSNPIGPVLEQTEATLRSGHCVWVVGPLPTLRPDEPSPPSLPPAPTPQYGWSDAPYTTAWGGQLMYFLMHHGTNSSLLVDPATNHVHALENMALLVTRGWRSATPTNSP